MADILFELLTMFVGVGIALLGLFIGGAGGLVLFLVGVCLGAWGFTGVIP